MESQIRHLWGFLHWRPNKKKSLSRFSVPLSLRPHELNIQQQYKQLDQLNHQHYKKVEEQFKIIIDLEKKLAVTSHQTLSYQQSNTEVQNKIEILRDEKLFLTQEKSQLEGQLKKLEAILKNYTGASAI